MYSKSDITFPKPKNYKEKNKSEPKAIFYPGSSEISYLPTIQLTYMRETRPDFTKAIRTICATILRDLSFYFYTKKCVFC